MSGDRDGIMAGIRRSLGRDTLQGAALTDAETRLASRPRGTSLSRAAGSHAEVVGLFITMAREAAATLVEVTSADEIPDAVGDYLVANNLPAEVRAAPHEAVTSIEWSRRPTISVSTGRAEDADLTSLTVALAGVAETGTLFIVSGADTPTTLNFMPDNSIVVLRREDVVGGYEDAWDMLRKRGPAMPRNVNLVTGPSRTGDIEQQIQLGAHGPRRLHIILVGDDPAGEGSDSGGAVAATQNP